MKVFEVGEEEAESARRRKMLHRWTGSFTFLVHLDTAAMAMSYVQLMDILIDWCQSRKPSWHGK